MPVKVPRRRRRRVSVEKKLSTALNQEAEAGVKWNVHRGWRVAGEPGAHLRVLVTAVVVGHHVDRLARWDCRLDGVEETDELTVAMALHAAAEHGAFQDVEGGKQGRGAVAGVVVRLSSGMPGSERLVGTRSAPGPGSGTPHPELVEGSSMDSTTAWAGGCI